MVARRVAEKYSIESDIKAADVVFCGDEAGYTTAIATPQSAVYAYLEQVKINGETKEGNYAVVMKRWNVKMGDTDATEELTLIWLLLPSVYITLLRTALLP